MHSWQTYVQKGRTCVQDRREGAHLPAHSPEWPMGLRCGQQDAMSTRGTQIQMTDLCCYLGGLGSTPAVASLAAPVRTPQTLASINHRGFLIISHAIVLHTIIFTGLELNDTQYLSELLYLRISVCGDRSFILLDRCIDPSTAPPQLGDDSN
jgi:hypothetical protein